MPQLAELWRAKYPGDYDDLDDNELEDKVLAKYPQYQDLASPREAPPALKVENPEVDKRVKEAKDFLAKPSVWEESEKKEEPKRPDYGLRPDGTSKGNGFLGPQKLANGKIASEYSIADSEQLKDEKGNYLDYPTLIPGLTPDELKQTLDAANRGVSPPQSVKDKAEAHALERKRQGKSLFATLKEEPKTSTDVKTEEPKKGMIERFLQGFKDLPESLYEQVNKTGKSASEHVKKGEYGAALHDIFAPAIDPFTGITSAATNVMRGEKPIETTPEQAKEFAIGALGVPGDRVREAWENSDYARLAGQGTAALAGIYLGHKLGGGFGESEIRQPEVFGREVNRGIRPEKLKSTEIPYRQSEPSALEGLNYPDAQSQDLPIRRANTVPADLVPIGSEDIFNFDRPTEQPSINTEEELFRQAVEKFNMGRELGSELPEAAKNLQAPPEEIPIRESVRVPEESRYPADESFDLGEISEAPKIEEQIPEVTAKHIGTQPGIDEIPAQDLFNIEGGPEHGMTVTEQGLRDRGLDIPERNPQLAGKSGDQIRAEALVNKQTEKPKFINPFEKKEEIPVNQEKTTTELLPEEEIVEMHGGPGGAKKKYPKSTGPSGTALDQLFSVMGNNMEQRVKQDLINKTERARRFAASASVKDEGLKGAKQSLGAMRGEYEKVTGEELGLKRKDVDSLFTAVKRARISEPEKVRGRIALFKLMEGGTLQRNELALLNDVFGNNFANRITEHHGGLGAIGLKLTKTANTMKAMRSSFDFSAPLRQGIGLIYRPEYRAAFKEMFKYFGDKEYYNDSMNEIHNGENYTFSREAGLFLAKPETVTGGEEAFMNNYLQEAPELARMPFDASERAYTGFLNKLRADTFDNLIKLAESSGNKTFEEREFVDTSDMEAVNKLKRVAREHGISEADNVIDSPVFIELAKEAGLVQKVRVPTEVAKNIAKYINVSTGRGGLGKLEKIAPELNTILWSPRLISSRLTMLNPKYYMNLDSFTRREAIKSLFSIATTGSIIAGLGAAAGGKVSGDITNADFGKVRFGKNVLDQWAGFQQPIVAAARMVAEVNRMASGRKQEFNKPGLFGIAGNFGANKLSPMAALAYEIGSAKKFNPDKPGEYISRFDQKKNMSAEVANSFVPMFIQDVKDVFGTDANFADQVGLDTASLFGMGVQNYPEAKTEQNKRKLSMRKPSLSR